MMLPSDSGDSFLDGGSPGRKRVFSPGFVTVCIIVVTIELVVLQGLYGSS